MLHSHYSQGGVDFVRPNMMVLPEQIEAMGGYVLATYYLQTAREVDIVKKIASIAIEQTTGTWVAVPERP